MQKDKAFFCACTEVFLLALGYRQGARSGSFPSLRFGESGDGRSATWTLRARHPWRPLMKLAHVAFILLLFGACSSAEAHTFEAPDTVVALPGGAFHYSWVFTAVNDTANVGAEGWSGVINTPPGVMVAALRAQVLPGNQIRFEVSGSLTNPAHAGLIENWLDECENFTYQRLTVILPFRRRPERVTLRNDAVVADVDPLGGSVERAATRSASWGAMKARYRPPRMAP